jgi:hypothetical protein
MDATTTPVVTLTPEERLDLRKRVLAGHPLSLEEARAVIDSFRLAQGAAMLSDKTSKKREKRPATTDEQLDADLEGLGL